MVRTCRALGYDLLFREGVYMSINELLPMVLGWIILVNQSDPILIISIHHPLLLVAMSYPLLLERIHAQVPGLKPIGYCLNPG